MVWEGWHREVSPYPDLRRIFLVAAHPGEGRLTRPIAATQGGGHLFALPFFARPKPVDLVDQPVPRIVDEKRFAVLVGLLVRLTAPDG